MENKNSPSQPRKAPKTSGVKVIDIRKQIRLRDVRNFENLERAARAAKQPQFMSPLQPQSPPPIQMDNFSNAAKSRDSDTHSQVSRASTVPVRLAERPKLRRRRSRRSAKRRSSRQSKKSNQEQKPRRVSKRSSYSLHQQLMPTRGPSQYHLKQQQPEQGKLMQPPFSPPPPQQPLPPNRQVVTTQLVQIQQARETASIVNRDKKESKSKRSASLGKNSGGLDHAAAGTGNGIGMARGGTPDAGGVGVGTPEVGLDISLKHIDSVTNTRRLKQDGRKVPEDYRRAIEQVATPSQLSLRNYSEYYAIPDNFNTIDDVFRYRGYKKLAKIDEGAFGIVSKVMRLADKEIFAVKEVDLRRKRAKRIQEMKRELFVLQKIDNKHVVKLIEHFVVGQTLVIIMEFCGGNNLTAYLKENTIGEQESIFLFKQMALSLKVLHRKCIAHRDVKLNNFLLDNTRTLVKIADFGLSVVSFKQPNGVLMAKTYCGTEPYMAPEILRRNSSGLRCYNPLYSDIWSLGICLYAMLTRTFPFRMHSSQDGLLKAQVMRRWRFPRLLRDSLSEDIKDLIWHMLDPEAERRITITGVISHPWLNHGQFVALSNIENQDKSLSPSN